MDTNKKEVNEVDTKVEGRKYVKANDRNEINGKKLYLRKLKMMLVLSAVPLH